MGYEVEIKFRDADHAAIERRLLALGAEPGEAVEQEDVYLAHPARDFAATGEAFRLRRDGPRNRLTYKGPKHAGPTKTREEVEVGFDDGAAAWAEMARLLEALGFRPVATVRKIAADVPPRPRRAARWRSSSTGPKGWATSPRSRPWPTIAAWPRRRPRCSALARELGLDGGRAAVVPADAPERSGRAAPRRLVFRIPRRIIGRSTGQTRLARLEPIC